MGDVDFFSAIGILSKIQKISNIGYKDFCDEFCLTKEICTEGVVPYFLITLHIFVNGERCKVVAVACFNDVMGEKYYSELYGVKDVVIGGVFLPITYYGVKMYKAYFLTILYNPNANKKCLLN